MAVKKNSSEITVGAVGLGYVGQPFVGAMAEAGFNVVGLDIDQNLINKLSEDYEPTVYEPGLKEIFKVHQANISFTSNYEVMMQKSDAIFLSVGTPLNSKGEPDSKSIEACVSEIAPRVKNGQLIILRSTVVPGTTRWLAEQIQKRTGLQPGTDFFVAFSPERTVSGNAVQELKTLPAIVGGMDAESTKRSVHIMKLLSKSIVITTSSPEIAEVAKLVDNMYRTLNIGFANELGLIAEGAGIDAYEVVSAVNKSYERTSVFRPALGAEGPCLSKDPLILRHFAQTKGVETKILDAVVDVNKNATDRIALEIIGFIEKHKINNPVISLLGLAFKGSPETDDVRGSPAIAVIDSIQNYFDSTKVTFQLFDPIVTNFHGLNTEVNVDDSIRDANIVVVMNDHKLLRNIPIGHITQISKRPLLVIDAWHSIKGLDSFEKRENVEVFRVGDGQK